MLDRHVQLNWVKIDDHASHLGGVLLTDHLMDMLVNRSTDDLLTGVSCRLGELGRVEHAIDLRLVDLGLVSSLTDCSYRLALVHLLIVSLLHLLLLLVHLVG